MHIYCLFICRLLVRCSLTTALAFTPHEDEAKPSSPRPALCPMSTPGFPFAVPAPSDSASSPLGS